MKIYYYPPFKRWVAMLDDGKTWGHGTSEEDARMSALVRKATVDSYHTQAQKVKLHQVQTMPEMQQGASL